MVTETNGNEFSPLSKKLMAASQINGLDILLALSRIGGRQNVLESSMEQTIFSIDERLPKMEELLSEGDCPSFAIEAHGLKSALAGIGAVKHSILASDLESNAKEGELELCKEEYKAFSVEMQKLAGELRTIFYSAETQDRLAGDKRLLLFIVRETVDYLSAFETDEAIACLNKLNAFSFGEEADEMIRRVKHKMTCYQYEDVLGLLGYIELLAKK